MKKLISIFVLSLLTVASYAQFAITNVSQNPQTFDVDIAWTSYPGTTDYRIYYQGQAGNAWGTVDVQGTSFTMDYFTYFVGPHDYTFMVAPLDINYDPIVFSPWWIIPIDPALVSTIVVDVEIEPAGSTTGDGWRDVSDFMPDNLNYKYGSFDYGRIRLSGFSTPSPTDSPGMLISGVFSGTNIQSVGLRLKSTDCRITEDEEEGEVKTTGKKKCYCEGEETIFYKENFYLSCGTSLSCLAPLSMDLGVIHELTDRRGCSFSDIPQNLPYPDNDCKFNFFWWREFLHNHIRHKLVTSYPCVDWCENDLKIRISNIVHPSQRGIVVSTSGVASLAGVPGESLIDTDLPLACFSDFEGVRFGQDMTTPITGYTYTASQTFKTSPSISNEELQQLILNSAHNNINVYPNPSNNLVNISYFSSENQPTTIELYNALGQKVINVIQEATIGSNIAKLDVKNLAAGTYTLHAYIAGKKVIQKVNVF